MENHVSVLFCLMSQITHQALPICKHCIQTIFPQDSVHSSSQMHGWIIYLSLKDDLLSAMPINNRHIHMESAGGQNLMPTTLQASSTPTSFRLPWSIFNLVQKLCRINDAICQSCAFMRHSEKCYGKSADTVKITSVEIPTVELKQM